MLTRNIAEGHARPERAPAGDVVAAGNAGHIIAAGVKPLDWRALFVQHSRMPVRLQPRECSNTSCKAADGVVWRLVEGTNAGIGRVLRIAIGDVEGVAAAMEIGVFTFHRKP